MNGDCQGLGEEGRGGCLVGIEFTFCKIKNFGRSTAQQRENVHTPGMDRAVKNS